MQVQTAFFVREQGFFEKFYCFYEFFVDSFALVYEGIRKAIRISKGYFMARKASSQPTEVELEILNVFWQRGPSTVSQIHDVLKEHRETGLSTTLKMVQVMTEKGLLIKDDSQRPQIFSPAMSQSRAQAGLVDDLMQRAFGGAVDRLVMAALESKKVSQKDVRQIKKLIDEFERGRK
jgi:BlaI family transcriptional regulator, penicillinase repressor